MQTKQNDLALGLDLGKEYTQLTYCGRTQERPITAALPGSEDGTGSRIPTPENLFYRVEQEDPAAHALLADHIRLCLSQIGALWEPEDLTVMVTLHEVRGVWVRALKEALLALAVPSEQIFVQSHLDSFFYYLIHQKKEIWQHEALLLEYGRDVLTAWKLSIDRRSIPNLAGTERAFRLYFDRKARKDRGDEEWDRLRDDLLCKSLEKLFGNETFSSAYLVGDGFDGDWPDKSIRLLCGQRKVFQGLNLYTRGACYAAAEKAGLCRGSGIFYAGDDVVQHNVGIWMEIRGVNGYHSLVPAGVNWYMAETACEFLLNYGDQITLYVRNIQGEEKEHTIPLDGLPERPPRTTRIRMTLSFTARDRCQVYVEDLGLGEFYPASGKSWTARIRL